SSKFCVSTYPRVTHASRRGFQQGSKQASRKMDGSRGATGAVDVGVSHLNMNINVIGGGHGLGSGLSAGDKSAAGDSTVSSSPPVAAAAFGSSAAMATSSSNGGLPSGRSRSPGFDVDKPTTSSSSPGETTASSAAAAAFLAGATVVTGSAPG
ncbi:unnamed protein product, partial [Ectocarpus sp. 12 AP-2014]